MVLRHRITITLTVAAVTFGAAVWVFASPVNSSAAISRTTSARSYRSVQLKVDGKLLGTEPAAVTRGGRVFLPIDTFKRIGLWVNHLGKGHGEAGWPESDDIIEFRAGRGWYPVDGPKIERRVLPGVPFVRRGVLMVPLRSMMSDRDVGTSLTAEWDHRTRTVHVHRSKRWLRWRMKNNRELINGSPGKYETPI